jgi:hypothetical protein
MEGVIVALIGLVGSVLVVLVEKGRKENQRDHGIVADKLDAQKIELEVIKNALDDIDQDMAHIEVKLDDHLDDHRQGDSDFGGFDIDDVYYKTDEKTKDKKGAKKNSGKKR